MGFEGWARLPHVLDDLTEAEADQLWAEEAERRYAAYKAGEMESVSADELFARLRSRKK